MVNWSCQFAVSETFLGYFYFIGRISIIKLCIKKYKVQNLLYFLSFNKVVWKETLASQLFYIWNAGTQKKCVNNLSQVRRKHFRITGISLKNRFNFGRIYLLVVTNNLYQFDLVTCDFDLLKLKLNKISHISKSCRGQIHLSLYVPSSLLVPR